jgi:hypothetical protein
MTKFCLMTILALLGACGGYEPPEPGTAGGPCIEQSCSANLTCAGGYCVPEASDAGGEDVQSVTDSTAPQEDLVTAPDTLQKLTPGEKTYEKGGLYATYYGEVPKDFDNLGEPILSRVEEDLNLTKNYSDIAAINGGQPFAARFQGALYIPKSGVYRIGVTGADSVRCRLGGMSFAEFWKAGILVHAEKSLELEEGWYSLDIVYVRSTFLAHIQLWIEGEDSDVGLAGPDILGYDTALPEDAADLSIEFSNDDPSYYAVDVQVSTNVPVVVSALGVDGGEIVSSEAFVSNHSFSVPLDPGKTQSITLVVTDLWGREEVIPLGLLTTPALPEFVPGGLLGEYHEGTNFETLKVTRIDWAVNYPYAAGGDTAGNFGAPVNVNSFSIRWSGGVYVETPGSYTFHVGTDDGRRLWLDGVLIADEWYGQAVNYSEVTVDLVAGWHPLTLEMYESGGAAHAYLEWSGPDLPRGMISGDSLGYIVPKSDGKKPALDSSDVWFGPQTTTGNIFLETSELCTATFKLTSKGSVEVIHFDIPSTVFGLTLPNLPNLKNCADGIFCGANSKVELIITDLEGNTAIPGELDVSVKVPPNPAKHADNFDGEALDPSWKVVTQGKDDNTANWMLSFGQLEDVEAGMMIEDGNANGNGPQVAAQYGTFLWNQTWTFDQGRLTAHVFAGDDDGFGLMYGIQGDGTDPQNHKTWKYYRVVTARDGKFTYAAKVFNDVFTVLDSNPDFITPVGRWVMIEVLREGTMHTVFIEGVPVLKFPEASFGNGTVAVYSYAMNDLRVDWVSVESN